LPYLVQRFLSLIMYRRLYWKVAMLAEHFPSQLEHLVGLFALTVSCPYPTHHPLPYIVVLLLHNRHKALVPYRPFEILGQETLMLLFSLFIFLDCLHRFINCFYYFFFYFFIFLFNCLYHIVFHYITCMYDCKINGTCIGRSMRFNDRGS